MLLLSYFLLQAGGACVCCYRVDLLGSDEDLEMVWKYVSCDCMELNFPDACVQMTKTLTEWLLV